MNKKKVSENVVPSQKSDLASVVPVKEETEPKASKQVNQIYKDLNHCV